MSRTYSREQWDRAKLEWERFTGAHWAAARQASSTWTIFPPSEEGSDEVSAEHPSQRVIIWFALEERPVETLDIIRRSTSWFRVVEQISASRRSLRRDADWSEEEAELERRYQQEGQRSAMATVGQLLATWKDSV